MDRRNVIIFWSSVVFELILKLLPLNMASSKIFWQNLILIFNGLNELLNFFQIFNSFLLHLRLLRGHTSSIFELLMNLIIITLYEIMKLLFISFILLRW